MRDKLYYESVITFFTTFVFCGFVIYGLQSAEVAGHKSRSRQILSAGSTSISSSFDSYIDVANFWEVLIKSNGGQVKDFEKVSKMIMDKTPCIKSILIAPKGVVKYVYPLEGNERSMINVLTDPNKKIEAEWAKKTGLMTLTGPTELYQGGEGIILRNPVYLDDSKSEESFWGFTEVIIRLPDFLIDDINLSYLSQDFNYRLWRSNPESGRISTIVESNDELILNNPISNTFEVPNAHWTLSISPKKGWVNKNSLIIEASFAFIISILVACVSRYKGLIDNIMFKMGLLQK